MTPWIAYIVEVAPMGIRTVTTFEGIITFDQDKVRVSVGLDPNKVTLVTGDVDIGEWSTAECLITDEGSGTWLIEAEGETLSFVPDEPGRFAHSLEANGVVAAKAETEIDTVEEATTPIDDSGEDSGEDVSISEEPPPKTRTLIAFYVLAVITAALGVWAFVSLF